MGQGTGRGPGGRAGVREAAGLFEEAEGGQLIAADFHRHEAYLLAGRRLAPYGVRRGSRLDALKYALGANATHGKPRTGADKRRAVRAALEDPELSGLSARQIAELCQVSPPLVGEVRRELTGAPPD